MTTRPTLPQNYILAPAVHAHVFSDISKWAPTASVSVSQDDVHLKDESYSINFTGTAAGTSFNSKYTLSTPINFGGHVPSMGMWIYIDGDPTAVGGVQFDFFNTYGGNYVGFRFSPYYSNYYFENGWYYFRVTPDMWATVGNGVNWNADVNLARISGTANTGKVASFSLGGIDLGVENRPKIVIGFDDGLSGVYDNAFPILQAAGIPATFYVCSAVVGNSEYCTKSQLLEMQAAGWTIANHFSAHQDMDTMSGPERIAAITDCAEYLIANDMPHGAWHIAYPAGLCGSDALATAHTISQMNTGRTTSLYFDSVYDEYVIPGRASDILRIPTIYKLWDGTVIADLRSKVYGGIKRGSSMNLYGHTVGQTVGVPSMECTTEKFQEMVDFLVTLKPLVDFVTIDEWYNGLTNPRYRSLPVTRAVA